MLSQAQVEEFRLNGFLLGDKILDADEVEVLRGELARVIKEQDAPVPQPVRISNLSRDETRPVWQIVNIWQASEPFRRLVHNPRIVREISQLTGAEEIRIWHDQIQYKPAEVGGINAWHQDSPYWPILSPKTSQVTAWVALDDVDESNGCMRMVAQSYLWGNQIDFLHKVGELDVMPSNFRWQRHRGEVVSGAQRQCPLSPFLNLARFSRQHKRKSAPSDWDSLHDGRNAI